MLHENLESFNTGYQSENQLVLKKSHKFYLQFLWLARELS